MKVSKILLRTLLLAFIGFSIIGLLCVNELVNGTGLTHPIWDITYNWLTLFKDILYISFVGALLSVAAGIENADQDHNRKPTIRRGYQYGH